MVARETKRREILDARPIAEEIKREVAAEVARLSEENTIQPCLAAVLVGDNDASTVYVRNKMRACAEVGIKSDHHALPTTTTTEELLTLIADLNRREDADGILVPFSLPQQMCDT